MSNIISNDKEKKAWFIASLIHDLGKIFLDQNNKWGNHKKLEDILNKGGYNNLIKKLKEVHNDIFKYIKLHHEKFSKAINISTGCGAISLADKINAAMRSGVFCDTSKQDKSERYTSKPISYTYYGKCIIWERDNVNDLIKEVINNLNEINIKSLIEGQITLLNYPYFTPTLPQVSLYFHHRFTALIMLFLYKILEKKTKEELNNTSKMIKILENEFKFFIVRVFQMPNKVFYRLKDINLLKRIMDDLRIKISSELINIESWLGELEPDYNPFFFFKGDELVIVYDNLDVIDKVIESFIRETDFPPLIIIRDAEKFYLEGVNKTNCIKPEWVKSENYKKTFGLNYLSEMIESEGNICYKCHTKLTQTQELLCDNCYSNYMNAEGVVDILKFAEDEYITFVILNTPELREHAKYIAEKILLKKVKKVKNLKNELYGTPQGLLEYLQSCFDMDRFYRIIKGENGVKEILITPELLIWVMRESIFWNSFGKEIVEEMNNININTNLNIIFCSAKYPVWSIFEEFLEYRDYKNRLIEIYDERTGCKMVFEDDTIVDDIYEIANFIGGEKEIKSQLSLLRKIARSCSLKELNLDIDARNTQGKLRPYNVSKKLKTTLEKVKGDDDRSKMKRSLILKYIRDLLPEKEERRNVRKTKRYR